MSEAFRAVSLRIRGHVQGVNYRNFACAEARQLGLEGWVVNRPDGSVEAVAFGAAEALATFVSRCRQGPPHAQVSGLDVVSTDRGLAREPPAEAYRF